MEIQRFGLLSASVFVFFFTAVWSEMETPEITLQSTVFVALRGEDLDINCELKIPANQTTDHLTCYDSSRAQIYTCIIHETLGQTESSTLKLKLELNNVTRSGEYYCKYKGNEVFLFLRVANEGYKEPKVWNYSEFIAVAIVTGVLLLFSVAGSVYVFRGYWKEYKQKKGKTEEVKEQETQKDSTDVVTAPSASFYASLEPRPRSIYDVLDPSAANTSQQSNQSKPKPKKKEPKNMTAQTTQSQNEDAFESVYENF
ncbi:uncharacterized protein V6R79_018606 [Siganus canaliculatus]